MAGPTVRVEGLKEVQAALRKAKSKDLDAIMRTANKESATLVVNDARPHVPVVSGKLAASMKAQNTHRNAVIKLGTPKRVPYAGPIHFGWPARGIKAQPFLSKGIIKLRPQITERYAKAAKEVLAAIDSSKG